MRVCSLHSESFSNDGSVRVRGPLNDPFGQVLRQLNTAASRTELEWEHFEKLQVTRRALDMAIGVGL